MALITAPLTGATTQVLIPDCHGLNTACVTRCESSCHLHNLFTTELNIARLRDGKCIQLGDLGDLTKAANGGCNLSRGLIERLSEDAEFQAFLRKCTGEPTIDAYAVEPAEIQALNLTFRAMATKQVNPLHAPALFDPHFHTLAIVNCDPVAQYIRNRPPVSEVASEASFAAARDWLSTCRREHHKCPMESGVLPSRVLDVGTKLGNEKVRLRATAGKEGSMPLSATVGGARSL
ncbi:hypothetical protein B0O99DRAFT_722800 [Bisporella sp. PMI_857]|nr:hypothetical protein B0O99DRAFT_722800 [Bisporella sp. PMI_857]